MACRHFDKKQYQTFAALLLIGRLEMNVNE